MQVTYSRRHRMKGLHSASKDIVNTKPPTAVLANPAHPLAACLLVCLGRHSAALFVCQHNGRQQQHPEPFTQNKKSREKPPSTPHCT